jgi:hypothetical protein
VTSDAITAVLVYGLWPAWMLAGLADWLCHRRTRIEDTSGLGEWLLHVVQAAQLCGALLLVVLFEITAPVLALLAALVVAHWLTGYLDTRYTFARRPISPIEQSIHGCLELLPVFAVVLLGIGASASGPLATETWQVVFNDTLNGGALAILATTVLVLGIALTEEGLRCRAAGAHPRR